MTIVASELKFYLSGGAANTDVNASIGGAISSTEVTTATLHNLFDTVSSGESDAGDTNYRCIYCKNTNGTDTLESAKVYISANTASNDTAVRIGLGTSALDGTETAIANEATTPAGVTFSTAINEANALSIGNMAAGQTKAVWIERVINAGAGAVSTDTAVVTFLGETI